MSLTATKEPVVLVGLDDATPLLADPVRLRGQADRDGYLFFKELLPSDIVLELRGQILEIMDRAGWIRRDADLMEGLVDRAGTANLEQYCGVGVSRDVYLQVQKLELFHRLPHHPKLLSIYHALYGEAVLPHPRNIARLMIPHPTFRPTPIHQDFIHIQGTRAAWTCWLPLGDVPRELGGLSVLRGSHKAGVLAVTAAEGAGGLESIVCNIDMPWIEQDYHVGDVLTFHSCTVHKSLPHRRQDRVRLSVDYRYQPAADDIEEKSLQPHCQIAPWDELYEGWSHDDIKYYWTKQHLQLSPWDESIRWQKERICD